MTLIVYKGEFISYRYISPNQILLMSLPITAYIIVCHSLGHCMSQSRSLHVTV